ncbi:MAG TPA: cupin domain-containing protein [Streptosporangiaceae bacterium]
MADFVIREWNLAPYPDDQAPRHIHHRSDEAFYVLDGQLEVLVNDERRTLGAGELVHVSAGTVHTFANRGPAYARVLVVMTPEVDELIAALHLHGGQPVPDLEAIWARYNSSVLPAY